MTKPNMVWHLHPVQNSRAVRTFLFVTTAINPFGAYSHTHLPPHS